MASMDTNENEPESTAASFAQWRSYDVEQMLEFSLRAAIGEEGEEPDYVTAHVWLNLAAGAGSEEARVRRAELAIEMSREEIARSQKIARDVAVAMEKKAGS